MSGQAIIVSAPSGAGKTSIVKHLLAELPRLAFSISACSRPKRESEVHGKDYYFYKQEQFEQLITEGAFAEWEMVYAGKYYGTLNSELQRIWDEGKTPLVDIDVKGALAVKAKYPDNCLTIFIEAPSLEALRERLKLRGTETDHSLEERVSKAATELTFAPCFDRILVNDKLDVAARELLEIVSDFSGC